MESVRAFVALCPSSEFHAAFQKAQREIQLGISAVNSLPKDPFTEY
jgi:hypothetical protein